MTYQHKEYLDSLSRFYSDPAIPLNDIGINVAHNAATNPIDSASAFVNQEGSIRELLERGLGLELDLHWNSEKSQILVCHY